MNWLASLRATLTAAWRRHRKAPTPAGPRLRVRLLENRTLPSTLTVTSAADDGSAGTLRAVLAGAAAGDVIRFAHGLDGQTITLTQGKLAVSRSVDIAGPGAGNLAIRGSGVGRIFDISAGTAVTISGLRLEWGRARDGGAVLNAANLTLSGNLLQSNVARGLTGGGLFDDGGGRGGAVENRPGAILDLVDGVFARKRAQGGARAEPCTPPFSAVDWGHPGRGPSDKG
jgi:hypothetical protein